MEFKTVNFEYVRCGRPDGIVILRDLGPWDEFKTITNAPEWTVENVCNDYPSTKMILYYDSSGKIDLIRFKDGKFKGFSSCPNVEELLEMKSYEEEVEKISGGKESVTERVWSWFPQMRHVGDMGETEGGATKRDVFAAAALTGLCANPEIFKNPFLFGMDNVTGIAAYVAWKVAEKMMSPDAKEDPSISITKKEI